MQSSNHSYSVPIFVSGLQTLSNILTKATDHAKKNRIDFGDLVNATVPPDKKPLSHQIRGLVRIARTSVSYLSQTEISPLDEPPNTIEGLQNYVSEAITTLKEAGIPEAFKQDDSHLITFSFEQKEHNASLQHYLRGFAIPDFFFHLSNAYTILKMQGIPLSKTDHLREFMP